MSGDMAARILRQALQQNLHETIDVFSSAGLSPQDQKYLEQIGEYFKKPMFRDKNTDALYEQHLKQLVSKYKNNDITVRFLVRMAQANQIRLHEDDSADAKQRNLAYSQTQSEVSYPSRRCKSLEDKIMDVTFKNQSNAVEIALLISRYTLMQCQRI